MGFIPKNIIEIHMKDIKDIKNIEQKKEIIKEQKKVILIPLFIKLSKLDFTKNPNSNAIYKYDIYLPVDTLFNKLLIPYVPVDLKQYKVSRKVGPSYVMTQLLVNTFNKDITNINLMSVNPTKLNELTKLKYVLFFTDNMKIYDNRNMPYSSFDMHEDVLNEINNIYTDYFNFYQAYYNKVKVLTNFENITNEYININEIKKIDFFSSVLNKTKLIEYYGSENYNKFLIYFKYIYFNIILNIDENILKYDNIEGIEDLKLISGPGNKLEKSIFTNILDRKELLETNLSIFKELNINIYSKDIINKNIISILTSANKLESINNDKINLKIKKNTNLIPKLVSASEFYKTQLNNPEYPELKATKDAKEHLALLLKNGIVSSDSSTTGSLSDLMIEIYPGLSEIGDISKIAEYKRLKGDKVRDFDPTKEYRALDRYIDTLITEEGAKKLIRDITVFNQRDKTGDDTYYKNKAVTNNLNFVFKDKEVIGIGEPIYKLNYYLLTQLKGNKLEIYKKQGQKIYKEQFEVYEQQLIDDIKEIKEIKDKEDLKKRKKYTPTKL
jgi:hypothetical protein